MTIIAALPLFSMRWPYTL